MAEKKTSTQAEKKVAKTKTSGGTKKTARNPKRKSAPPPKKAPAIHTEYDPPVPSTAVTALMSLFLLILFVVISVNPEGALLKVVQSVVLGLIGRAGFYFSIPALAYLFFINTFQRKSAARMRSTCLVFSVLFCGAIYHLAVQSRELFMDWSIFAVLYNGGSSGATGGVLCGGIAVLLQWACGKPLSYLIFGLAAVMTLLASMRLTPMSIARAIANRPVDDYEEDYIEPAAIVVNKIANKQIENKRKRREQAAQLPEPPKSAKKPEPLPEKPKEKPKTKPKAPALPKPQENPQLEVQGNRQIQPEPQLDRVKHEPGRGAAFMSRIDREIGAPLGGTADYVHEDIPDVFDDEPIQMLRLDVGTKELPEEPVVERAPEPKKMPQLVREEPVKPPKLEQPPKQTGEKKVTAKEAAQEAVQVAQEIAENSGNQKEYRYPSVELLKRPGKGSADGTEEMRENSRRLNETLASFRIDAHIINVTRGPSVTRYEVELDKGVRLNKLTGCADDIALSLGASGVRIAAVPGKISVVGIEVPNRVVTTVSLREVIDSPEFEKAKSKSSFAVGKDIGGSCIIGNIAKMPHLLIAGTTGSGKSVCMNSIIISLLYKASPEDVKLIMVDPKMVELGIYNGIPHLLIPVVTDPKKAAGSLQWAVTEMMRRYKLMSDVGVRDMESYNAIIEAEEEDGNKLAQIVVIIDELADMMMVAAKEVEDSICRIAQMGRAAGMHLIIATQRPSADVITGLMKANIPSRIAFSVASAMESRIILDTMGAEKLVGKGDMLFAPIGSGKPLRVQGCFVTDGEVEKVAQFVKENSTADYNQEVLEEIEKKAQQTGKKSGAMEPEPTDEELEGDEMLPQAVDVILETGQASVSMLQRRLKLGYARAARIVDEMEEKGIVGPFQGSKPRAILITKEQWVARQGGAAQMSFDDSDMGTEE